jgi:hypothetical protein
VPRIGLHHLSLRARLGENVDRCATEPDQDGKRSDHASKRLSRFIRETCGVGVDPLVKPDHSFRHAFGSEMVKVGVDELIIDYIEGHRPPGRKTSRKYLEYDFAHLAAELGKMRNPLAL